MVDIGLRLTIGLSLQYRGVVKFSGNANVLQTRSSAVAERQRPPNALCEQFCQVTQGRSRSFELTPISRACVRSYYIRIIDTLKRGSSDDSR